eukprot:2273139-Amphidinium_carterae.3
MSEETKLGWTAGVSWNVDHCLREQLWWHDLDPPEQPQTCMPLYGRFVPDVKCWAWYSLQCMHPQEDKPAVDRATMSRPRSQTMTGMVAQAKLHTFFRHMLCSSFGMCNIAAGIDLAQSLTRLAADKVCTEWHRHHLKAHHRCSRKHEREVKEQVQHLVVENWLEDSGTQTARTNDRRANDVFALVPGPLRFGARSRSALESMAYASGSGAAHAGAHEWLGRKDFRAACPAEVLNGSGGMCCRRLFIESQQLLGWRNRGTSRTCSPFLHLLSTAYMRACVRNRNGCQCVLT